MDSKKITNIYILIITIITVGAIIFGFTKVMSGNMFHESTRSEIVNGNTKDEQVFSGEKFTKIEANTDVCQITVSEGDDYRVSYVCSSSANDSIIPKISIKDDKLEINQKLETKIFGSVHNSCEVTITVPKGTQLDDISITTDVGDVEIEEVKATATKVTSNVGEVVISGVEGTGMKVVTNVGDVKIDDSVLDNIDCQGEVGDIEVSDTVVEDITCTNNVGDINIDDVKNKNGEDPQTKTKTGIGEVEIN